MKLILFAALMLVTICADAQRPKKILFTKEAGGVNMTIDGKANQFTNPVVEYLVLGPTKVGLSINNQLFLFEPTDTIVVNGVSQLGQPAATITGLLQNNIFSTGVSLSADLQKLDSSAIGNVGWLSPTAAFQKAPILGGRTSQRIKRSTGMKTLVYMTVKADIRSAPATITDVVSTDALYGTNVVQAALAANTEIQATNSDTLKVKVDVTNGIIRFWFKPIANVGGNLNKFGIELHSEGTPAAITANYHSLNAFGVPSDLNKILTSTSGTGRWQSFGVPLGSFTAVGTGADLTKIKFARLIIRASTTGVVMQFGNIEYHPNALTKAKCIISFDDGHLSQYTYAAVQMSKYGFRGVLFPSPVMSTVGFSSDRITVQQIKHLHDELGWQIGSQAWSTEDSAIVNAMSETQFTAELAKIRVWQSSLGLSGGDHGSYFSTVGFDNMKAWPSFRKSFRSVRAYFGGNAGGFPLGIGETFPFCDPMAVKCINGASYTGLDAGDKLKLHVDQAIANKGVAYFAWHNELGSVGNVRTGFEALLAYLDANRGLIDVVTEDELYSP